MPALPSITVSDAQASRCLAAWGSVAAYKAWLAAVVRGYVLERERVTALEPLRQQMAVAVAALEADDPTGGAV